MIQIDILKDPEWVQKTEMVLMQGEEVTLLNFSRTQHSNACAMLSIEYETFFFVESNGNRAIFFAKAK